MNEAKLDKNAVKQQLNRSLTKIDAATLAGLHQARMHALERHEARRVANPALAWINDHVHWHASAAPHKVQAVIAGLVLIACLLGGFAYWQQTNDDTSDVDIEILTGEMPIHVFLD